MLTTKKNDFLKSLNFCEDLNEFLKDFIGNLMMIAALMKIINSQYILNFLA
jgi:hypothetical protein